ncbi:MAG: aldo/keto reductase [Frondihabitans sp.]|nr:aldo/keto reductase [Frondihabitans sp.]
MTVSSQTTKRPGGEFLLGGRPVARVGFGVMQLAERHGRPPIAPDEAIRILRHAVELGINHFDTAEFYGAGEANQLIRRALAPSTDDIVLVSKVGAAHAPGAEFPLVPAQKPAELRRDVEANLASLGVEQLAVVNIRRADQRPGILATGDQVVDLDDQIAEMVALRDEGKIGAFGLSTVSLEQLEQALPAGVACVQNAYNLLERSDEPLLEVCRRAEIAWAPYFPLGSAFPGFPKVTDDPTVVDIATRLGVTPSQVGLAWILQHSPNSLLIAGTSSLDHLAENTAAGDILLDAEAMRALDAVA